jgi:hypothetical protein
MGNHLSTPSRRRKGSPGFLGLGKMRAQPKGMQDQLHPIAGLRLISTIQGRSWYLSQPSTIQPHHLERRAIDQFCRISQAYMGVPTALPASMAPKHSRSSIRASTCFLLGCRSYHLCPCQAQCFYHQDHLLE